MTVFRTARLALLACCLASLAACGTTGVVERQLDAESAKLATENMTLSGPRADVPQAAITPQGGFLIDGNSVALTSKQHAQMLFYRAQLVQISQQAFTVAKHGVKVGMRGAVPLAVRALFGESDEEIDQYMHKRLAGVFAEAAKICDRLPAVMATEHQLAASLPAFRPYANLTTARIDECRSDLLNGGDVEKYSVTTR